MLGDTETFSLAVAKVLVAARPNVLMVKEGNQGRIPLSTAVESESGIAVIE